MASPSYSFTWPHHSTIQPHPPSHLSRLPQPYRDDLHPSLYLPSKRSNGAIRNWCVNSDFLRPSRRVTYSSRSISALERLLHLCSEPLGISPRLTNWLPMFSVSIPYQDWLPLPRYYSTFGIPFNSLMCVVTYPRGKLLIFSIHPDQPFCMPPPHRTMCRYPMLCQAGN